MRPRHFLALALVLTASLCHAGDFCSYSNTNQLFWDKAFKQDIQNFFGKQKASYYWANGDLTRQAMEGLGGPADMLANLGNNLVLASACRAHSCTEKAAAILQCPSRILAVGIIHFNCAIQPHPFDCSSNAMLTLFFDDRNRDQAGRVALEDWGRSKTAEDRKTIQYEYRSQHGKLLTNAAPLKSGN